jgi:Asp-tRNA(Asn)/Glu-tRNA(Gln) amidotransferase A subunit family amidase
VEAAVASALGRLEAIDPDIRAFVDEPDRRGRLEADACPDGPLHGVPVAVKDLYRVDGLPTRAGSRLPASVFEGEESSIVTDLEQAGAVVLGKTDMDEFAYCEPPPTKNPRDPRRTPGGSSGGSAAAVAAGICRLATGSQTLQSVVVPAAYCGVVGYKTSFGRPVFDGIPLVPSIDSVGFLASSVADVRTAASAIVPDWNDPSSSSSPPVLGTLEPWGDPSLVGDGWRAFASHVELLRGRGFELRPTSVPWNDPDVRREWGARVFDLLLGEMAIAHAPWFDRYADLYRPSTAEAVRGGRKITAERIRECRDARSELAGELEDLAAAAGIDAWVCPSARGVAPIGYQDTGDATMTGLWSYAGFPAVSLPIFDGPDGLPLGIQVVTTSGHDEQLLAWAAHVETALG